MIALGTAGIISTSLLGAMADGGMPGGLYDYCVGARPFALGRAFTGLADDIETIYFNPGGLAFLQRKNVMAGTYWMPNIVSETGPADYYFAALSFPTATYGSFGITVMQLDAPDLILYGDTGGTEEVVWTGFAQRAGLFSYSKSLTHSLAIGGNLKVQYERTFYFTTAAVGVDLGMLFKPNDNWSIGVAAINFLPMNVKHKSETERYQQVWRLGLGWRPLEWFTLTLDASHSSHYQNFHFFGGAEARPLSFLYIRGGANQEDISGGGGFEVTIRDVIGRVDYTYSYNHSSQTIYEETQQISGTIMFSGYRVWANADPRLISASEGDINNYSYVYLHSFPRQMADEWTVLIRKQTGEVVRVFRGEGDPPVRIEWDGRDDSGRLVPPGNYNYHFEVIDMGGERFERSGYLLTVKKAEVW